MWDPYAEFEKAVLPNGLTVYAAHWPGRLWERVGFHIYSGGELDPVGKEGTAHFVEHLVSANAKIPGHKIYGFFEDQGGSAMLGGTDYRGTSYSFFVPTEGTFLSEALDLYGSMLLNSTLAKDVEKERQVILGEFAHRYPSEWMHELDMLEHKMLYDSCWLSRSSRVLGLPSTIQTITKSDLQSFYDTYYTPHNMSVVAVGGLTLEEVAQQLSGSPFALRKEGKRSPQPEPMADFAAPLNYRKDFKFSDVFSAESMPNVCAYKSRAVVPRTAPNAVLHVLANMLDHLLMVEVREKRSWTYDIDSHYYNHRHFYVLNINCSSLSPQVAGVVDEVIEGCIDSLGHANDLFEQQKHRLIAGYRLTDADGRKVCENAMDDLAIEQRIITLAELCSEAQKVSMEDIQGVLRMLQPKNRWTLLMRP